MSLQHVISNTGFGSGAGGTGEDIAKHSGFITKLSHSNWRREELGEGTGGS